MRFHLQRIRLFLTCGPTQPPSYSAQLSFWLTPGLYPLTTMPCRMHWPGLAALAIACADQSTSAWKPECRVYADCARPTDTKCRYHYCDDGTCYVRDVICFEFPGAKRWCDPQHGCFYKLDYTAHLACGASASCGDWVQFNRKCITGWACDKYTTPASVSKHCTWEYRDRDDQNPATEDLCGATAGCVHFAKPPTPTP